jgi:hypothetical protein
MGSSNFASLIERAKPQITGACAQPKFGERKVLCSSGYRDRLEESGPA